MSDNNEYSLRAPFAHPVSWKVRKLRDVCSKIGSGATPTGGQANYLPSRENWALVRSQNVFDRRFDETGLAFITDEQAATLGGVVLQSEDVLLNITGDGVTFARSCQIPESTLPAVVNQHVSIIRPKRDQLNSGFLLAYLTHPETKHYIEGFNAGGSRRAITKGHIEAFNIPLPPLQIQQGIAHILSTLDDKIELNRRTNETLEAMARAIFKSWFVDFDPIRAKAGELVSEKVLEIGDGYRAKNDELGDEGLPFIRAMNLKNGFDTTGADRLKPDCMVGALSKCSRVGDVAFTSKGTVGRFARVGKATEAFVYSPQVCFWRTLDSVRLHPAVLYCWMQSDDFLTQLHGRSGQTDMAPYVSLRDQRGMFIPRFDASQAEVGRKIAPLLDLVSENQAQSRTLSILRDTLLPRLLSGEIEIDTASREMDVVATC